MRSEEIIRAIYYDFSHYFKSGNIIIGGSYFYSKLGIPVTPSFKDIDLIVDNSKDKDSILFELNDFFKKSKFGYNEESSFIKDFTGDNLISCIVLGAEYPLIDILRNDFSTNLSNIEIISGVFSNYQTSKKLIEVYDILLEGFKHSGRQESIDKFTILKNFYENNDIEKVVESIK